MPREMMGTDRDAAGSGACEVGEVTSARVLPAAGPIALGFVRATCADRPFPGASR